MPMTDTPDDVKDLAQRLFAHEKLHALAGGRVKFTRDVERAPFFTVPKDSTGTILTPFLSDGVLVAAVKLDASLPGSEPFEDEVHWTQPMFDTFAQDLELTEIPQ